MIAEYLAQYITAFIASTGYLSVFILMVMESMIFPVPSEAVMPFAGFLIAEGTFTFAGVVLISTLGSIVGSFISYYIGMYGGKPFLDRYGKFFLISRHDLEFTHRFFEKHGTITIFISRFIPVIRHLISLPAGIARMDKMKFAIYTIVGAAMWNSFLMMVGYYLRQNWAAIMRYSQALDIVVLVLLFVAIGFFIHMHRRHKRHAHPQ